MSTRLCSLSEDGELYPFLLLLDIEDFALNDAQIHHFDVYFQGNLCYILE